MGSPAKSPLEQFTALLQRPEDQLPLTEAALLVACTEYPNLDPQPYSAQLEQMGHAVSGRLGSARDAYTTVEALNHHLFNQLGFRGNRDDYYDPRNSFLSDVIDRRTGIPITLSVIYMDVATRVDMPLVGIGLPGHFLVGHADPARELYLDPFNQGLLLTREDCQARLREVAGQEVELEDNHLEPVSKRALLFRLLNNLRGIYIQREQWEKALTILAWMFAVAPDEPALLRDRGLVRAKLMQFTHAIADLNQYLERVPDSPDRDQLRQTLTAMADYRSRINQVTRQASRAERYVSPRHC
jgi:regulator of sirC expression with transglutaminase-like and TPR domain